MSPVLAAVTVGIGVPILLFYVYGVVPVSLCRSGGCGVTTSGAGVKFEFDDENDYMSQLGQLTTRNQGTFTNYSALYLIYFLFRLTKNPKNREIKFI